MKFGEKKTVWEESAIACHIWKLYQLSRNIQLIDEKQIHSIFEYILFNKIFKRHLIIPVDINLTNETKTEKKYSCQLNNT